MRIISKTLLCLGFSLLVSSAAFADQPAKEEFREQIGEPVSPAPEALPVVEDGWKYRISPGLATWFFKDEDNITAPGLYFDAWPTDVPINLRIGVEGRHLDLEQNAARSSAEFEGLNTEVTYVRIPMAVEYRRDLCEKWMWTVGGGPDILRMANDVSEWDVGLHLGTRLNYNFAENWSVGVEGGYMWATVGATEDIDMDGWYLNAQVGYNF